jgi:hypothetical protein
MGEGRAPLRTGRMVSACDQFANRGSGPQSPESRNDRNRLPGIGEARNAVRSAKPSRKKNQLGAPVVSHRATVAVVEYQPNDRTYVAKRAVTDEVIAVTPDRHEAYKAAREDHAVRVAEARKEGLKPTRTSSRVPITHIRMGRRRNELVRLAAHRQKYGIDLGDLGRWAWVMGDALAFGPHGADYFTFEELAAKMGIDFPEPVAMRAIRCVNAKIKIKRKNYCPFAGRAVARMLDVTAEERWQCKIQTIAAVDETEGQAEARRREDGRAWDRERDRRRRAAAGATPRRQSLSATRPWDAFGYSRRTWERRGKPDPAGAVANSSDANTGDSFCNGSGGNCGTAGTAQPGERTEQCAEPNSAEGEWGSLV